MQSSLRSGERSLKANENEAMKDAEEAARMHAEETARLHALKVVEVLKNEIKVNDDIFFYAVDHSMQNEEYKMMKMKNG